MTLDWLLDWLRRLLGIDRLSRRVDSLLGDIRQIDVLARVTEEQAIRIGQLQEEMATRHKVMRDELMESEARLMTRIEELESQYLDLTPAKKTDTLEDEPENKSGYVKWSDRKRATVAANRDDSVWVRRFNGDLSRPGDKGTDVRGRNNEPSPGAAPVATEGQR